MTPPPMVREPLETTLPTFPLKREALWTEVQSLLDKGAIEEIPLGERGGGGVLLPLLPCNQKNRCLLSHSKSLGTKCLSPRGEVQNENPVFNSMRSTAGHLDGLSRSEGRLPSRPDHPTTQEVSEVLVERSATDPSRIPMGSPSIWVGHCPQSIHQAFSPYRSPLAYEGICLCTRTWITSSTLRSLGIRSL